LLPISNPISLIKTHYEAVDWWNYTKEFYEKEIPQTYRETILRFAIGFLEEDTAKRFSRFAELRNILTHEYLLYPLFIEKSKEFIKLADKRRFFFATFLLTSC